MIFVAGVFCGIGLAVLLAMVGFVVMAFALAPRL
jgi:hypothetical protein